MMRDLKLRNPRCGLAALLLLLPAAAALAPGTRAELTIARAGKPSSVAVELGRRPAPRRKATISR